MAKSNFIVRGGADFSNLYKGFNTAQKRMTAFQAGMQGIFKKIGLALGGIAIGKLVKDSTEMAMSVESAFDNISRNMGEAAGAFSNWANTQSQALGMAKADAYKYGSTFSNLLSSFTSGAKETADQTQELMKAAAIIASKTGRTYEDTANRIRSGLLGSTEAIEDLGVYVNVSMLESTQAFKKFANGKSWSQLSYQTQQQIRLAAILEQTYARYGDTLADTTQTRQAQFVASLKNIQLSLGQAFLPVYNAVLPALTAMANAIGRIVNIFAQFMTALFGAPKQIQAQANAMENLGTATDNAGKSAKKAAKAAKGALAGFDEINKLNKANAAAGGGGIGGSGAAVIPTTDTSGTIGAITEVSQKVQEAARKVKDFFGKVASFISENKATIISAISGIVAAFAAFQIITNWTAIVGYFSKALAALSTAITSISLPIVAVAALIGAFVAAIVDLWQTNEEFRDNVTKAWNGIKDTINKIWQTVLKPVWDYIKDAAKDIWNSSIKPLWENFKNVIKNLTLIITDLWNNVLKPVIDWVIKNLGPPIAGALKLVIETVKQAIKIVLQVVNDLMSGISDVLGGIRKVLSGLIDFITGVFTGNWKKAWEGVKKIFSGIWDTLKGIVKAPLNFIIDAVNTLIRGINKFKINIPDWVANLTGIKAGYLGFNIPTIPRLAQGGIITSPTIAMVGEAGAEAVMPLERNTGWIDILASKLASAMQGVQLAGAGDIYVYVGNEQVESYIYRSQNRRNIRSNGR